MTLAAVLDDLADEFGLFRDPSRARPVSGGSFSTVLRVESVHAPMLLKVGGANDVPMFEAEREGLEALAATGTVRVPEAHASGTAAGTSYLLMEWLDLTASTPVSDARLGRELAELHRSTAASFGWHRDNTIGSTPQPNGRTGRWVEFLRERRLEFQLRLAVANGLPAAVAARCERLLGELERFFVSEPAPSLLHGDLWAGNRAAQSNGAPCVFDPAVYYGDRETDIAMTRLFGGFDPAFYSAYEAVWPLGPGSRRRVDLYNLYHLLNHFNLFGSSYLGRVKASVDALLGSGSAT